MSLTVPFDEWEILYRERLQVEREVFGDGRAIGDHQPEGAEGAADDDEPAPQVVQTARSLGAVALVALAADRLVRRRSSE